MSTHCSNKTAALTFKVSTLVLCMLATGHSLAAENATEYVRVIGQAASINEALKEQRKSNSISSVVHADAIAKLPDDNAAEALQRIPGVSTERDQGEGRFVTVRGLGTDLNAVTINGTLVPAPEASRRGVALDVLPAELVQSLTVIKTLTPDMDANSLGGTIQVESLSAFDHDGLFYTAAVEGGYDEKREEYSPKVSGAVSQKFSLGSGTDNFGVAAALSWQERTFGSDNVETGGKWEDGLLEETEMRQYDIERERLGAGLNFDFRPNKNSEYYLRTLYSRFQDNETRQAAGVEFSDPLAINTPGSAEVVRELKEREETQEIKSFVLGGKNRFDQWTLEAQLGYSEASEKNPGGIAGAGFVGEFDDLQYSSTRIPVVKGGASFYDPSQYELDEVEWEKSTAKDKEKNAKFDLSRDYLLNDYASIFKFGAKVSQRTKTNDTEIWKVEDLDTSPAHFGSNGHYELAQFGPTLSSGPIHNQLAQLNLNDWRDAEESVINDYKTSEDIHAAYVMNTIDFDRLRVIAGLRYEDTDFETQGYRILDGESSSVSTQNDYDHWLPSLHLKYQLSSDAILRAAWTNTVVRPNFEQSRPGIYIDGDEAEFGNPNLKPLEASNFDLGVEKYFGDASVISMNAFYKDIDHFIYNANVAGTGDWTDFDEAMTFKNGSSAKIYGVELGYSQKWHNFIFGLNSTFSRAKADIDGMVDGELMTRTINFPSQSKVVGNAMIGWENDRVGLRLAANYKSRYLNEISGIDEPEKDLYTDDQVFVDLSGHVNFNKNIQLFFNAQNLTDEVYYNYNGNHHYNAQYEEYGPSYKVGLKFTHF